MHVEIAEGIRSILIVEDEGLVAMMLEDLVREMGAVNIYSCSDVASALKIARDRDLDCAVLDLWVRDGSSAPVADILAERNVPFVFSTGTDADELAPQHSHRPMIGKPFTDDDFKLALLDAWTLGRPRSELAALDAIA